MDTQKEREAFESWFSKEFRCDEWEYNPFSHIEFNDIAAYSCSTVNAAWAAWQAAKAQASKQFENFIDQAIEDSACIDERRSLQYLLDEFRDIAMSEAVQEKEVV